MEIREHAARVRELVDEDDEDAEGVVVLEGATALEDEASGRYAADTRRRLRTMTALTVGGLAVLLAVASLKGDETTLLAGVADRGANENWTQYQAKRTRQLAHDEFEHPLGHRMAFVPVTRTRTSPSCEMRPSTSTCSPKARSAAVRM